MRVFIDTGRSTNRELIRVSDVELGHDIKLALIRFHASTWCDYNSSFFRKGKEKCWKLILNLTRFQGVFLMLGSFFLLPKEHIYTLEEFACYLYSYKSKNIDNSRFQIFNKKYIRQNKVIDLSSLPPCKRVLFSHSSRANSISHLWKSSL